MCNNIENNKIQQYPWVTIKHQPKFISNSTTTIKLMSLFMTFNNIFSQKIEFIKLKISEKWSRHFHMFLIRYLSPIYTQTIFLGSRTTSKVIFALSTFIVQNQTLLGLKLRVNFMPWVLKTYKISRGKLGLHDFCVVHVCKDAIMCIEWYALVVMHYKFP